MKGKRSKKMIFLGRKYALSDQSHCLVRPLKVDTCKALKKQDVIQYCPPYKYKRGPSTIILGYLCILFCDSSYKI